MEPDLGGRYNSDEDIQSYAGAAWLPFISEIRKKEEAIGRPSRWTP